MRRPLPRRFTLLAIAVAWTTLVSVTAAAADRFTGPWKLDSLRKVPPATWGEKKGVLQEVYYEGEPLDGKPTRVFAYMARPAGTGPFPAMLLVHGGGGAAFPQWAELWAKRGYVALAMDLAGCGPDHKRLPDGGPSQDDTSKFGDFSDEQVGKMWTYHAVAAVLRGHSLLAAQKEVDGQRIGVTGISWGGYLTCIIAGIDDRLKAAVPVYGCGYLHENSAWLNQFARMSPEQARRWVRWFDPSRYLPGASCPIFFVNGTNDFAYPLDSYQKCYRLVSSPVTLRIQVEMPHGHEVGWAPQEIGLFIDSILKGGPPLPGLTPLKMEGNRATTRFRAPVPLVKAQLHYTSDIGKWQERKWHSVDARIDTAGGTISAALPDVRPLVYYLSATDQRGAMISTGHATLP